MPPHEDGACRAPRALVRRTASPRARPVFRALADLTRRRSERRYAVAPGPLRNAAATVQAREAYWQDGMARFGEHLDGRG